MKRRLLILVCLLMAMIIAGCNDAPNADTEKEKPTVTESVDNAKETPTEKAPSPTASQTLTKDEQYKINIFLSNFSEQWFSDYDCNDIDEAQLIHFAYLNTKINDADDVQYTQDYYYLSKDAVNKKIKYYLDVSVSPTEGEEFHYWGDFHYENGNFYFPAADGESYSDMSVAQAMEPQSDGSIRVPFQIYSVDEFSTGGDVITDKSYYYLTPSEAKSHGGLTYQGTGTAWVKRSGDSFVLIRYELD